MVIGRFRPFALLVVAALSCTSLAAYGGPIIPAKTKGNAVHPRSAQLLANEELARLELRDGSQVLLDPRDTWSHKLYGAANGMRLAVLGKVTKAGDSVVYLSLRERIEVSAMMSAHLAPLRQSHAARPLIWQLHFDSPATNSLRTRLTKAIGRTWGGALPTASALPIPIASPIDAMAPILYRRAQRRALGSRVDRNILKDAVRISRAHPDADWAQEILENPNLRRVPLRSGEMALVAYAPTDDWYRSRPDAEILHVVGKEGKADDAILTLNAKERRELSALLRSPATPLAWVVPEGGKIGFDAPVPNRLRSLVAGSLASDSRDLRNHRALLAIPNIAAATLDAFARTRPQWMHIVPPPDPVAAAAAERANRLKLLTEYYGNSHTAKWMLDSER